MRFLYSLGVHFYGFLIIIASHFSAKAKKRLEGQRNTFRYLSENIQTNAKYVWFHAASLGEFEQGRPIMEKLRKSHPEYRILLTFFSPSGYEVRKNYQGADLICYLPLDTLRNVSKFVRMVNPVKAIFIKYEFWPNFILECRKRHIPMYVVSAHFRKDQAFFKWYGKAYAGLLKTFNHIFVQDESSVRLLDKIGINNTTIVGDTRFDRVKDIADTSKNLPLVEAFVNGNKTIVAGSSWPKDEDFLIRYAKESNVKLVLAPHEIPESHLKEIERKWGGSDILRYTDATSENVLLAKCLIINNYGMLSSVYKYATVAYIGGGFGVGIHNVLEAAVYGLPLFFGPNYHAFREACELVRRKAAISISNYETFVGLVNAQFVDAEAAGNAAAQYVKENLGATDKILSFIF